MRSERQIANSRFRACDGDVHHGGPERMSGNELYLSMRQCGDYAAMRLIVHTTLPPSSLATSIKLALRPIDPNLPVTDFQMLQDLVDKVVSPRRFLVMLLSGLQASRCCLRRSESTR